MLMKLLLLKLVLFLFSQLIMLNLQEQPINALEKYGFIDVLGKANICSNVEEAIERANSLLEKN